MSHFNFIQPETRVRNIRTGQVGRVVLCINPDDAEDLLEQGPRYYVKIEGHLWSMPSWVLRVLKG